MPDFLQIPLRLGERITIQLGRTPMLSLTFARFALFVALMHEGNRMVLADGSMQNLAQNIVLSYFGWNMLCMCGFLLFPRWELLLRPFILLIDFLICTTLIVLLRPLELPSVLCCLLLLWAAHERHGKAASFMAALSFILAFLFRNQYEPLAQDYSVLLASDYTDSASIFIGSLIALSVIGSHLYQAQVKNWGDQLQAAGGNLSEPPIEFLMQQVASFFHARTVYFISENANDPAVQCSRLDEDAQVAQRLPSDAMRPLLHPPVRDAAFLFAASSDQLFFRNRFGGLKFCNAPEYVDLINEMLPMKRGASFSINAGPLRGRFYVARNHGWSPSLLNQCDLAADSVDVFFERSFFLEAWRDRAFTEARLALSSDLHDSILQTLAAMRMRFSTLLPKVRDVLAPQRLEELEKLQSMLIAEQSRLRQLLNESKRINGVSQNLAESLSDCAEMLSGQWNIECHVCVDPADVEIDRSTAIEVEFLVREAVANAVQHAAAQQVTIAASLKEDTLLMAFRNDSIVASAHNGHAPLEGIQSHSLSRRLQLLGGTAYFDNLNDKTLLSIRIPLRDMRKRV